MKLERIMTRYEKFNAIKPKKYGRVQLPVVKLKKTDFGLIANSDQNRDNDISVQNIIIIE